GYRVVPGRPFDRIPQPGHPAGAVFSALLPADHDPGSGTRAHSTRGRFSRDQFRESAHFVGTDRDDVWGSPLFYPVGPNQSPDGGVSLHGYRPVRYNSQPAHDPYLFAPPDQRGDLTLRPTAHSNDRRLAESI